MNDLRSEISNVRSKSKIGNWQSAIGNRQLAMLSSNGFRLNAVLIERLSKFLGDL